MANDGLIPYTLGRDYGEHPAGTVIRVDPERKSWLDASGYQSEVSAPKMPTPELDIILPSRSPSRRRPMLTEPEKEV